ncbi:hypothetical protein CBR_g78949, partial [Chara braunii]
KCPLFPVSGLKFEPLDFVQYVMWMWISCDVPALERGGSRRWKRGRDLRMGDGKRKGGRIGGKGEGGVLLLPFFLPS